MKKLAVISVVFAVVLTWSNIAFADNGPHGGYTATTDKCAACHRAHTAKGTNLLNTAVTPTDVSGFCYTCHGGGSGAYTDVRDGVFITTSAVVTQDEKTSVPSTNRPLRGGGFENVQMNAGLTGSLILSTTSNHMVTGGSNTVWGYSASGNPITTTSDAGAAGVALTCTNCHNPHGKAGPGNTATHRILKNGSVNNTPLFANGTVTVSADGYWDMIDYETNKTYYIEPSNKFQRAGDYPDNYFGAHGSIQTWFTGWCSQCHTRHDTYGVAKPGSTNSGDPVFAFRHPLSRPYGDCLECHANYSYYSASAHATPGCTSCHMAHGTGARMGTYSNAIPFPDGNITTTANARSSLLRLDNRGVCQGCHKK